MVCSGKPESIIALHTTEADEYILKCVVKSMTHVELTRDVRWGDNYCIWLFFRVGHSMKIVAIEPEFIGSVLHFLGIILLCKFLCHNIFHFSGE